MYFNNWDSEARDMRAISLFTIFYVFAFLEKIKFSLELRNAIFGWICKLAENECRLPPRCGKATFSDSKATHSSWSFRRHPEFLRTSSSSISQLLMGMVWKSTRCHPPFYTLPRRRVFSSAVNLMDSHWPFPEPFPSMLYHIALSRNAGHWR